MDWTAPHVLEVHDRELKAQKELILSEIRRIDEEIETQIARFGENLGGLERRLVALDAERDRAQQKFEDTVKQRFVQQNELRGALDDLSQNMATRREVESAREGIKAENGASLAAANARADELTKQLSELRSRIDTGAPTGQQLGYQQRGQQVSASMVAYAGLILIGIGILVAVLTNH